MEKVEPEVSYHVEVGAFLCILCGRQFSTAAAAAVASDGARCSRIGGKCRSRGIAA